MASSMPTNLPAGFTPDAQQNLPPGFVPDASANVPSEAEAFAHPPVATPTSWLQARDPYSGQAYGPSVPPAMARQSADVDRIIGTSGQIQNRAITPVTDAATVLMPAAGMGEAIAERGIGPVLGTIGRGLAKTAAGATVGSGMGAALGSIAGHPKEGAEIGATVGGLSAPFVPNRVLSSAPYGLSRLFLTNEELAAERAAMKVAQRNADIGAGLRKAPGALPSIAEGAGSESVAGTRPRSLVLTPEEASSEERMQGIAKKRASERGMQFAAGMTPREGRSVPRMPNRMASADYPPPREITVFDERGNPLGKIRQ